MRFFHYSKILFSYSVVFKVKILLKYLPFFVHFKKTGSLHVLPEPFVSTFEVFLTLKKTPQTIPAHTYSHTLLILLNNIYILYTHII